MLSFEWSTYQETVSRCRRAGSNGPYDEVHLSNLHRYHHVDFEVTEKRCSPVRGPLKRSTTQCLGPMVLQSVCPLLKLWAWKPSSLLSWARYFRILLGNDRHCLSHSLRLKRRKPHPLRLRRIHPTFSESFRLSSLAFHRTPQSASAYLQNS